MNLFIYWFLSLYSKDQWQAAVAKTLVWDIEPQFRDILESLYVFTFSSIFLLTKCHIVPIIFPVFCQSVFKQISNQKQKPNVSELSNSQERWTIFSFRHIWFFSRFDGGKKGIVIPANTAIFFYLRLRFTTTLLLVKWHVWNMLQWYCAHVKE